MLDFDDLAEIPLVPEATTVIGDMNSAFWYIRTGKARRDWERRIAFLQDDFDSYVAAHPNGWRHIIIPSPE